MKNCGKWSDVVAVTSLDVISYEIYLEEILLQRFFEWEVILFDRTMQDKNMLDDRKWKNCVALCCSYFGKLTLKSPKKNQFFDL